MASDSLMVVRDRGVVTATINRPDKLNALNKEIFEALTKQLDILESDKSARVLILSAVGNKAFCVGADLKERQGMNEKDILIRLDYVRHLYLRLDRLPIPIVCAVNGMALGGGLELALVADLRIAAKEATFGLPEVDLAIIPGNGGTQRLTRTIGLAKSLEMILLAKKISAEEALSIGLVHQVCPAAELATHTQNVVRKLLEAGPIALRQAKRAIKEGYYKGLDEAMVWETEMYKPCLSSKDRLEGLKAFAEKRKPEFLGM